MHVPTKKIGYYAGEILYPDYVHQDTLIVVNPTTLEMDIRNCEGTDEAIDYILHKNCAVLNQSIGDFQLNVNRYGYTLFDTRDTIHFEWDSNGLEDALLTLN